MAGPSPPISLSSPSPSPSMRRLEAIASHLSPSSFPAPCLESTAEEYKWEHGGDLVGEVLKAHGVRFVFTLSGGHIAPILVGCKKRDIRVIDVRHEVNAVFAADAVSRSSDSLGVAVLTAGPGLTNTITAVKNAQMAQSPLLVLGGATATLLKGRGSLQDIDQMALFKSHVKYQATVHCLRDIVPTIEYAIFYARSGVPGPVFVEFPLDILFPENFIRDQFEAQLAPPKDITTRLTNWYVRRHINNVFSTEGIKPSHLPIPVRPLASKGELSTALKFIKKAKKPVFILGSQVVAMPELSPIIAEAVTSLGIPTYLSGMSRGLLGRYSSVQYRHSRGAAVKEADLVLLAGVPFDFRLGYGRGVPSSTPVISVNLDTVELNKNRKPTVGIIAHSGDFLIRLAKEAADAGGVGGERLAVWHEKMKGREDKRENEIERLAEEKCVKGGEGKFLNPMNLLRKLENVMDEEKAVMVADGGDFVATASYIVRPRGPLGWLDPGPFGTLGVGAGFALGVKLCRPDTEVWLIWGDGSSGYSLMEYDTFVRHNIPVISLIGNDACWSQIYRDQITVFKDDVACMLTRNEYHKVSEALGAVGMVITGEDDVEGVLREARREAREGKPVVVNAHIGRTNFRDGSLSV
uniref:Acetolactate synthase n=1 Tax=Paramoeba aestuarina TaxID=180227 RepID=A0A7S4NKA4_9EUKA